MGVTSQKIIQGKLLEAKIVTSIKKNTTEGKNTLEAKLKKASLL